MKIKNIFKKDKKEVTTSNIQKMDKAQLEKVVGGTGIDSTSSSMPNRLSMTPTTTK